MSEEYASSSFYEDEATPDALMTRFKGPRLTTVIVFALIGHVVVIAVTSPGFLKEKLFGSKLKNMSKEELINAAFTDATASVRDIARAYGVSPQEISDRFAKSGSRSSKIAGKAAPSGKLTTKPKPAKEPASKAPNTTGAGNDKPLSDIEKKVQEKAPGPKLPDFKEKPNDKTEDLF